MTLMETIRAYLGWCPMQASMRPDLAVRPAGTAAPGGQDGLFRAEPGWERPSASCSVTGSSMRGLPPASSSGPT